ncbi:MAG: spore cortex-lytic enzyme [Clostridia bacterium]|nr:spore cortex-lytic enzyme [Clostridia bacterium]
MQKRKQIEKTVQIALCVMLLVCITAGILVLYTDLLKKDEAEAVVLKQGSTGQTIKTIQSRLKQWGYYTGGVDGIFGPKTAAAVRYFQSRNGLVVDGIVGAKTAAALGISLAASSTSYSNDIHLLARCIYAEARGEPYVGQVAIAAVVLNRVKSPSFPNTISGVIYQPLAFTAVADGQINLSPDNTAIRAANDAMNGWDPTYGCLFYYNPATATNAWIRQKAIHLTIGRHVFCV